MFREEIKKAILEIEELSKYKKIKVVSHFDCDGICSAAIFSRALSRWGKEFLLEIVKGLEADFIKYLPDDQVLIFLDLASGSLDYLAQKNTEVFIFDHHEIVQDIPKNVRMINPVLDKEEPISGAAVCYFFAKELSLRNRDLATLGVIGMVGDLHEKNIGKTFNEIIEDSVTTIKKGLMIYPSTRPLDKALEYCSSPFLPGVTGSFRGVMEVLRDAGIEKIDKRFKALYELTDDEMGKLVTALMLKCGPSLDSENLIGNLFLVKFFNKLEDAREISALINACSRMGFSDVALGFCMGNKRFRERAEEVYIEYRQSLVAALRYVEETEKIQGENYVIINGQDVIRDTIIGTVASILAHSPLYKKGSVIIALAYNEDKIKVSARLAGRGDKNVREVLHKVVVPMGGEVGGHPLAAGCLISRDKEKDFISEIKRVMEIEATSVSN